MSGTEAKQAPVIAFIGGGNMAGALIGGLRKSGHPAAAIRVVEPWDEQRARLAEQFGVASVPAPDASLAGAAIVVWAVKPQSFGEAAQACAAHASQALQMSLHLSVMAGIRSDAIARAMGTERVVRSMPNTPALIGQGIAGLYARPAVSAAQRAEVERLLAPTGATLWVEREDDLDAVTALSGSGPAYVFYFLEAMTEAAREMGLSEAQGRALAMQTFAGATALAQQSSEPPSVLRERVTSKGGTTFAALESMRESQVGEAIVRAVKAAQRRAAELGSTFG
jgi:pyrroline-5-carboxylate reductase